MTVLAIRGTHTNAMINAIPTRNWAMFDEMNAREVYRNDASSGWTARLSTNYQPADKHGAKGQHQVREDGLPCERCSFGPTPASGL